MPITPDNGLQPTLAEAVCTFAEPHLLSEEMGIHFADGVWEGKTGLALSAVISLSVATTFAVGC